MALSDDLRKRVVASAVRWVKRFETTGEIPPAPWVGDRRSGRIEAHRDYLLGLIRRAPDITLLEIQERLAANCSELPCCGASSTATKSHSKKVGARRGAAAFGRSEATAGPVRRARRPRSFEARFHRRNRGLHQSGAQERALPARATATRRRSARHLQDGHARRRPAQEAGARSIRTPHPTYRLNNDPE